MPPILPTLSNRRDDTDIGALQPHTQARNSQLRCRRVVGNHPHLRCRGRRTTRSSCGLAYASRADAALTQFRRARSDHRQATGENLIFGPPTKSGRLRKVDRCDNGLQRPGVAPADALADPRYGPVVRIVRIVCPEEQLNLPEWPTSRRSAPAARIAEVPQ